MHQVKTNTHKLQPLLPIAKSSPDNPLAKLPTLDHTTLFHKYLLPKLQGIPTQPQIQQFMPFDPTIIEIFDEQDMCTRAMLTDLIIPYSSYMLGDSYMGGWQNEIERVSKLVRTLSKLGNEAGRDWYVRVFIPIPNTDVSKQQKQTNCNIVYKTYKVNIKPTSSLDDLGIIVNQFQDQSLPLDISIEYARVGSNRISAIVLQPHSQQADQYAIIIEVQGQTGTKIHTIEPTTNSKTQQYDSICCDNMDMMIRQLVLMEQQLTTFYHIQNKLITSLATYYANGSTLQFSHQLVLEQSYAQKYQSSLTESQHILQLFRILTHFHNLNFSLSKLDYRLLTPTIVIFTNFTHADSIQSKQLAQDPSEEVVYDILCLITTLLDHGYTQIHRKSMEQILHLMVDPREIIQKWKAIMQTMSLQCKQKMIGKQELVL